MPSFLDRWSSSGLRKKVTAEATTATAEVEAVAAKATADAATSEAAEEVAVVARPAAEEFHRLNWPSSIPPSPALA